MVIASHRDIRGNNEMDYGVGRLPAMCFELGCVDARFALPWCPVLGQVPLGHDCPIQVEGAALDEVFWGDQTIVLAGKGGTHCRLAMRQAISNVGEDLLNGLGLCIL